MVAHTISALRRLGVNEFYICRGWKGAEAAVVLVAPNQKKLVEENRPFFLVEMWGGSKIMIEV